MDLVQHDEPGEHVAQLVLLPVHVHREQIEVERGLCMGNPLEQTPGLGGTKGLVESTPRIDSNSFQKSLFQIPGSMPKLDAMPSGCAFHPRCEFSSDICTKKIPPILHKRAACWLLEDGEL